MSANANPERDPLIRGLVLLMSVAIVVALTFDGVSHRGGTTATVLPANPAFADTVLRRALAGRLDVEPLAPLDDELELAAHERARELRR
jgi:hypothetical protein